MSCRLLLPLVLIYCKRLHRETSQNRITTTHTVTEDRSLVHYTSLVTSYNISFERQIYLSPYPTPLAVLHDLQTSILNGTLLRDC